MTNLIGAGFIALTTLSASSAFAQSGGDFDLTWNTIDGGGGYSSGGAFEIEGTIGQADAGFMSGDTFELEGGFWAASGSQPCSTNDDCNDDDVCTQDVCSAGFCDNVQRLYGDVDTDSDVDIFDILCVLDGFTGVFNSPCTLSNLDIAPCSAGDGGIDIFDILAVLDAFGGVNACSCAAGPMPTRVVTNESWPTEDSDNFERANSIDASTIDRAAAAAPVEIILVPDTESLTGRSTVQVDVYAEGVADLRGYQIALELRGQTTRQTVIDDVYADETDGRYAFTGREYVLSADVDNARLAGVLYDGATKLDGRAYLGSFVVRPTGRLRRNASFSIGLHEDSVLLDAEGHALTLKHPKPLVVPSP